jgi:amino-acid N-acetyltransferase
MNTATTLAIAVRKAAMRDIPNIIGLINAYAAQGVMLPRTEFEMSENIRDFSVAYDGGKLVGCAALHFYTPTVAEVRSLAVLPELKQRGTGRALVESLERRQRRTISNRFLPSLMCRIFSSGLDLPKSNAESCR